MTKTWHRTKSLSLMAILLLEEDDDDNTQVLRVKLGFKKGTLYRPL